MLHPTKVSASEIGDYVYCMNHWWKIVLGNKKQTTQTMIDGNNNHESIYTNIKFTKLVLYLSLFLIFLGLLIAIGVIFFSHL